jgi:hypothetical protein
MKMTRTSRAGAGVHSPLSVFLLIPFLVFSFPISARAQGDGSKVFGGVVTEEYDDQADQGPQTAGAQATLASLFGGGKKMAVPPQMAGGTIALPSFDSRDMTVDDQEDHRP